MKVSFDKAKELLIGGEIVALPTETVYGLAASLRHLRAIEKIFTLKGRPPSNPLIIHVGDAAQIFRYSTSFTDEIKAMAEAMWPGPLTLVLPIMAEKVPAMARAGLPTAAFRIPGHSQTLDLLKETGALVMPSANLSGRPSATCIEHVEEDFGLDLPIFDGGPCRKGVESTILCQKEGRWCIGRLGAFAPEDFIPYLGYAPAILEHKGIGTPLCPGQLFRHYAPKAELKLVKEVSADSEGAVIGFSDRAYPSKCRLITWGESDNPEKVAENLYSALRKLDAEGVDRAWVDVDFPQEGLWLTILERLKKAGQIQL